MNAKRFVGVFAWAMLAMPTHAADWPQYLGPNRNSTSDQKGIYSQIHV
jgi:hypothetical protein